MIENGVIKSTDESATSSSPSPFPSKSNCWAKTKNIVGYRVKFFAWDVPVLIFVAVCVGLGFWNYIYALIAAGIFGLICLLSWRRTDGGRSSSGYNPVSRMENGLGSGSRVKSLKDLPPLPRRGGG
jgi:hypothetical protein